MINRKQYLEAHIDKVKASIFQNETLIKWSKNGGDVKDTEIDKAQAIIDKDIKWLNFLEAEYQNES